MPDVSVVHLLILFGVLLLVAWGFLTWICKPVMVITFDNVEITTHYGADRIVERTELDSPCGGKSLSAGMNDFYITITEGIVRYHTPGEAALLTPILRSSEDILFFRLQIRVVGKRITRFEPTNLSKPLARLAWSKVA
ncbi:hypothetical protein MZD04_gp364 [Pseudomonas phage Psa21]|uniref:Uncharacterized protein n=1 Tax=Pseudomonas phage Psa21 TaxID=2530023 RepID=A0A481W4Y5_9CAUD|nr:hypothetical protein MZD04_gp364 [Pseudomonas phage Psa21]QBJ02890.1 hypothetical protein PSA21_364 [Pseudomonas phage Psa21]